MKEKSENNEIVKQAPTKENLAQDQSPGIDESRRSLTKAGFAAPALITLASRPVFGAQCSPSAIASGNLSNPVDWDTCGGCTPGFWGGDTPPADDNWPLTGYARGNAFDTVFGYSHTESPFAYNTLGEVVSNPPQSVINNDTGGNDGLPDNNAGNWQGALIQLGRQAVAALLNAAHAGVAYPMTPGQVITDFKDAFTAFVDAYDGSNSSIDKQILVAQKDVFDGYNNNGICPLGNDPKTTP